MMRRLTGMARHSNYVRSAFILLDRTSETEEQLRKGTHVFTLGAPAVVRGRVVDQQGHPIGGAEVVVGRRDSDARTQTTALDGTFALAGCKPGKVLLTAEAKGYACTTIEVEASNDAPPSEVTLPPGNTLRVRVKDRFGAPIRNASIEFSDEYDLRTGERKNRPVLPSARLKTDENGLVVWDSAPDVPLVLEVSAASYMSATGVKARPDGTEYVVVLHNSVTVSGTVRDEESGELLPRFRMICGWPEYSWDGQTRFKESSMPEQWLNFSGGTFKHTFREPMVYGMTNRGYMMRIEAEGYASFVTRTVLPDEREARLDIKMRPSPLNWITVLLPDGRTAVDTDVGLVSTTASLRLTPNGFSRQQGYPYDRSALIVTDAKGRFSWSANEQLLQIISANLLGYAEATPAELRDQSILRLRPWGRLEGIITSNGKPLVAQQLMLQLTSDARGIRLDHDSYRATTDKDGRFRFEKVPPTHLLLQRAEKSQHDDSTSYLAFETVAVEPGATTTLHLDARDRSFALQPRWPDGLNPDPGWEIQLRLQKPIAGAAPGTFRASGAPSHFLQAVPGGSYEAKDVLPGEFRVHAQVLSRAVPGGPWALEAVGIGSVTVPDGDTDAIEISDLQISRPPQAGN
jgi:protocatechuate 3,4-dioxygenase beta subunit